MASAFSPRGFGSRWLSRENSTSGSELSPELLDKSSAAAGEIDIFSNTNAALRRIDDKRIALREELISCERGYSGEHRPPACGIRRLAECRVVSGELPVLPSDSVTPASGDDRRCASILPACAWVRFLRCRRRFLLP